MSAPRITITDAAGQRFTGEIEATRRTQSVYREWSPSLKLEHPDVFWVRFRQPPSESFEDECQSPVALEVDGEDIGRGWTLDDISGSRRNVWFKR